MVGPNKTSLDNTSTPRPDNTKTSSGRLVKVERVPVVAVAVAVAVE